MSQFTIVERPLTDSELSAILDNIAAAESARDALIAAVIGTFDALMSDHGSSYAAAESIDPTAYRIPMEQWQAICGALLGDDPARRHCSELAAVNLGLDWVNLGPSGYGIIAS